MQVFFSPFATLCKAGRMVRLVDGQGSPATAWSHRDAEHYLRYWSGDSGALRQLRNALHRLSPTTPVYALDDAGVLRAFAEALVRGVLAVEDDRSDPAHRPPLRTLTPAAAAPAPSMAATPSPGSAAGVAMPAAAVSLLPLLPVLEQVRLGSADVLPEIEQTLAQVAISLDRLAAMGVSMEPTPSGIPGIQASMAEAGAAVNDALGAL